MKILQVDKLCCVYGLTQGRGKCLQGHYFTRASIEKHPKQLPQVWREHRITMYWQTLTLSSTCSLCEQKSPSEKKCRILKLLILRKDIISRNQFQRTHMNDFPSFGNQLWLNRLLYGRDFVNGKIMGKLSGPSVQEELRSHATTEINQSYVLFEQH